MSRIKLTEEQDTFIKEALTGKNILVDACIGSGKTTTIQKLCGKYHSNYGKSVAQSVLIQELLKLKPNIVPYDVLILDEYQDISQEISELLLYIKSFNPSMQIIAVGDMEQKIYDYTTLDVIAFIKEFLGDYEKLEFTKCFRLSQDFAAKLGRIWHKKITGVNKNCIVEKLKLNDVIKILSKQNPKDILCLGKNKGCRDILLNRLESQFPKKFNKNTVYAKISDSESLGSTKPNGNSAIFTTFDSSKGLEKKICVICDYTKDYWENRVQMPNARYEIIRNIFCVAASRGKERIIFLDIGKILTEQILSTYVKTRHDFSIFEMSTMFDFKYREDIKKCFEQLKIKKVERVDNSVISISSNDGLIDLSPCIGNYQEAVFFDKYNIDKAIMSQLSWEMIQKEINKFENIQKSDSEIQSLIKSIEEKVEKQYIEKFQSSSLDEKILYLTMLETKQERYKNQVEVPFVSEVQKMLIKNRLLSQFNTDEEVQKKCSIEFAYPNGQSDNIHAIGYCDVIKDDTVYELKFVSELANEHFLQCACYMEALGLKKGVLWNTKDNSMFNISIPNKKKFLDCVIQAITKGVCYILQINSFV
ncbi:P-loop containing nucleoside triphosphate hydrolase protein [Neocallimastix californiae]|uniref:p-loop containing nucleoside triphosphate hydrolase protein n=1 Tax=Neocallimastix californiae TaxID=1754190 RepID=A0A1Y2CYM0_9FUNG|nr:P-loop containing nucleoside triphosphate hydrolase protein [Neocallimastix californiae]|eukprot:ORY52142.1 P-loop containing nucleoside triphosphate hydrolase protein [Neocallimastix californiae]